MTELFHQNIRLKAEGVLTEQKSLFERDYNKAFVRKNDYERLEKLLKNKNGITVISGEAGSGKTTLAEKYIIEHSGDYRCVLYCRFKRERKSGFRKGLKISDNDMLIKSLANIFECEVEYEKSAVAKPFGVSPFERLMKRISQDALVVVDDCNCDEILPFLKDELSGKCKVIVVTDKTVAQDSYKKEKINVVTLCGVTANDMYVLCQGISENSEDYEGLFSFFGGNLCLCEMALKYLKSCNISANELLEKLEMIACDKKSKGFDNLLFYLYCLADFSVAEKEMLRTAVTLISNIPESTKIVSSPMGVFDKRSLAFYTKKDFSTVKRLIELGYVSVTITGRLTVNTTVSDFVRDVLKPDLKNCCCYGNFLKRSLAFDLNQTAKDVYAEYRGRHSLPGWFVSTQEFIEGYCGFIEQHENKEDAVYKSMCAFMLTSLNQEENEVCTYHLGADYVPLYLWEFEKAVSGEYSKYIYDIGMYDKDDILSEAYTDFVKGKLDVLRLCSSLLKNCFCYHYKYMKCVLETLYKTLDALYCYVEKSDMQNADKMTVMCEAMRICKELFMGCNSMQRELEYNYGRDLQDRVIIRSYDEERLNAAEANGIHMGYSFDTVRLYGIYMKYLTTWLNLERVTYQSFANERLLEIHNQKKEERTQLLLNISLHFARISRGYGQFYDFYNRKNRIPSIETYHLSRALGYHLENNRRLALVGFDGATERGAQKYCDAVFKTLRESSNPFELVMLLYDKSFPISDVACKMLAERGLQKEIAKSKNIANLYLQTIVEFCIYNYCEYTKCKRCGFEKKSKEYNNLLDKSIDELYDVVVRNNTFDEKLLAAASCSFVCCASNVLLNLYEKNERLTAWNIRNSFEENAPFTLRLYERIIYDAERIRPLTSEVIVARVLYNFMNDGIFGKEKGFSGKNVVDALKCIVYDDLCIKNEFSRLGIVLLSSLVTSKANLYNISCLVIKQDDCEAIDQNERQQIIDFTCSVSRKRIKLYELFEGKGKGKEEMSVEKDVKNFLEGVCEYKKGYFTGETDKNPIEYKAREKMVFTLFIKDTDGNKMIVPGVKYTLSGDDGHKTSAVVKANEDGSYVVEGMLRCDGFVHLVASAVDEHGNDIEQIDKFEGGAGADVEKIKCETEIPDDYLDYWEYMRNTAKNTETKIIFEREVKGNEGFTVKDIRLSTVYGRYVSLVCTYPTDAKEGTLGLKMSFMGYGCNTASAGYDKTAMVVNVNSHDVENFREPEYYGEYREKVLGSYGFDRQENLRPQTSYWQKMLLRDLQAYYFFCDHKLLSKKKYIFIGGSQGAMQACHMAAHTDRTTDCYLNVPWCCDLFAIVDKKRMKGWRPEPDNAMRYYDTAIAAKHLKCPVYIEAGLGDYVCPPSGQMAMYNGITSVKMLRFIQNRTHPYIPPEKLCYELNDGFENTGFHF